MPASPASAHSPWTALKDVHAANVAPVTAPLRGTLDVTGSKSWTNRALILAAVARGRSVLRNYLRSEDSYWCIESLKKLGVGVTVSDERVEVEGCAAQWRPEGEIFIGSAGTTARFLTSVLAFSLAEELIVTATPQMYERPMAQMLRAITDLGARIEYLGKPECLPLKVMPASRAGGRVVMSGAVSSQFISGVLMGAPCAGATVELEVVDGIVQQNYVRMTLETMRAFGVDVAAAGDLSSFVIEPQVYQAADYAIEADASTASYFMALAAVTGGDITIGNLRRETLQPDIQVLPVFEQLGCRISSGAAGLRVQGPARIKGGFTADLNQCSDMALTIAALAPFADAPIEIVGVEHIRKHESDRVAVMAQTLRSLGIDVDERADGWLIRPGTPKHADVATHDDHRVAMSLAVLAAGGAGLSLLEPSCVSKTCPRFFDLLGGLGVEVELSMA